MAYVGSLLQDLIFFSGDVKTTTIAIAISASLTCSIVLLVISLLNGERVSLLSWALPRGREEDEEDDQMVEARGPMVSFHLNRKSPVSTVCLHKTCPPLLG